MIENASTKYSGYRYDDEKRLLYRVNLTSKHLLWLPPFKGTPCFNKEVYDKYKDRIDWIGAKTDKVRFIAPAKEFEMYHKEIHDREPQYGLEEFFWIKTNI